MTDFAVPSTKTSSDTKSWQHTYVVNDYVDMFSQQRGPIPRNAGRGGPIVRESLGSSLGERIGNRLRMLHEMKEQAGGIGNRRKIVDSL